jgi:branched-chain amino acid transport system substrate-binding protein
MKYWIAGDMNTATLWLMSEQPQEDCPRFNWRTVWWKLASGATYLTAITALPDAGHFASGGASMANVMKAAATGLPRKFPCSPYGHGAEHAGSLGQEAPEKVIGTSNYFFYYPNTLKNMAFVKAFEMLRRYPKVGPLRISLLISRLAGQSENDRECSSVPWRMKVIAPVGGWKCGPSITRPCCPCSWG